MKKSIIYIITSILFICCFTSSKVIQFKEFPVAIHKQILKKSKTVIDIDSLKFFIQDFGYLDVSVLENQDTIMISLGEMYQLNNIFLNLSITSILPNNKNFTQKTITTEIEKILQNEKILGYQFATIIIDSTKIDSYNVDLFCSLNKGPLVKLDEIKFEGLTKTNNSFLKKYFTSYDSLITPTLLSELEQNAQSIPFVEYNPPIKQEVKQGYQSADIIIPFKEKENLLFEGGGGYLPDQELFVWKMNLLFKNIFGSGREISIVSQKKDISHQNLLLQYKQPLFLIGIGSANIFLHTRDYRDQFYEFLISSGIQTFYKDKINLGFSTLYKSVEQENNNLAYRSAELSFSISNNNSHTFLYDWKFSYGNRKYENDTTVNLKSQNSFNESRIDVTTQFFQTLRSPLTLSAKLHFQSYQTLENIPPFSELYLIGGTQSIRGFKDEQFPSIRNLIFSVEPKYQFDAANFFIFYDGGYIYNRLNSELTEFDETTIYRYGYGGGISFNSDRNSLKISLGWNKTLSFDNPRVSLELKSKL